MLDLWQCDKTKLIDLTFIYSLLDTLPGKIDMNKIAPPQVVSYPGKEGTFDKGGISGFVLIAESHITCHTFEEQAHVFIDIFSCKPFNIDKAVNILIDAFGAKKYSKKITDRGEEFPKDVVLASTIVQTERSNVDEK